MTSTRMTRAVAGELVREALMQARPAGLSKKQLAEATGLTLNQVSNGITWIREVAASERLTPLTYTRRDGYRFSDEPDDWVDFERATMLRQLTSIRRTLTGVADPHVQLMPDDTMANWMNAQFNSLVRTIEITLNPPSPTRGPREPTPA